ncbi:MAG: DUF222 domain-containing protein [Ilumatobacter sp.]|uniref:HNH endonuclease signature motif containing protein n=1 Tax=Ilumatobacter sp. TaxID=1967498 RepID=UPI003298FE24
MRHTLLSLDPVRDSQLWKAVNARTASLRQRQHGEAPGDRSSFDQLQAQAFVDAIATTPDTRPGTDTTVTLPGSTPAPRVGACASAARVPEIAVLVDWALLSGLATSVGLICETDAGVPIPVSTVRRMCCDADVFPVVLGADGVVLDQGRSIRTADREQRRALSAMHSTCAFPSCDVPFDACRIHHVRFWWQHHGTTDIENLLPVCEPHHHLVHEGRWSLTMAPDRVATWTRPDGTIHYDGQTMDRRPNTIPLLT